MRRMILVLTIALAMVLACAGVVLAQGNTTPTTTAAQEQQSSTTGALASGRCSSTKDGQPIPVMTRNLYLGADLSPVFAAAAMGDGPGIIQATTAAWQDVKATNFPERAGALADEIEHSEPLLVGLQEVSLFRTGPPDSISATPTPAEHVEFDYLDILLKELDQRGLHYAPVTITQEADAENPGYTAPGVLQDIRLTDRDVILARTDVSSSKVQLSNKQTGNYATYASLPIGQTGQSIKLLRGWGSVDVTLRGQTFRFINTHLEQEGDFNAIQVAQGNEILKGPAKTSLPVILVGDFNSRADGTGTPTYSNLIGAGFKDAWSATHPGELGNTWGHDADLLNTTVNLTQRLDLVLFRNTLSVTPHLCGLDADVVGDELSDRTPSGLWPSDHAGVVATLRAE
jgi:endonuclease/exonuclease/phosphatase family metal-dependent hydrolase